MRVYPTQGRNYLVKAVSAAGVLYDVTFPIHKETEYDRKEREIRGVAADVQRNTNHNLFMDTAAFAVLLAEQGHFLEAPTPAARKIVDTAIRERFNG